MFLRHPIASVATVAYLALVGWITLSPLSDADHTGLLWRIAEFFGQWQATDWITFSWLEFAANVAMFVPFGIFFVLLLGRRLWWLAIGLGVVLTVGIELAQLFIPSRVSDPRDLLANTIGTVLGTLVALLLTVGDARRVRASKAIAAGA